MRLGQQVADEMEKARLRGEPITPEELQAHYALPAGAVDHTDRWLRVIQLVAKTVENPAYKSLPIIGLGDDTTIPAPGQPWAEEATIALFLGELEPTLTEIQELSANPGEVRIPHDFHEGISMLLPHVQDLRQVARMLALRAKWQVYHGDSQGALESLIAIRRTADVVKYDPIMISQLVRIAINGVMATETLELVPHANWSDAQLHQLQTELLSGEAGEAILHRSLVGERALSNLIFEEGGTEGLMEEGYPLPFTRRSDQLRYLQYMARSIAASEQPFIEAQIEFNATEAELAGEAKWEQAFHPFTGMIAPAVTAMQNATGRATASDRATATLLACQRYQLATGNWPAKLSDLTPDFMSTVPVDPFDGQPLRYVVTPTAVIVYSVGENLVDDGGIAPPTDPNWRDDHAYSIELTPSVPAP